ncbi:MAG: hypothetical protein AB4063_16700 [Crocosphaera sp.]
MTAQVNYLSFKRKRTRVYKVVPVKINVKEVIEPHKAAHWVAHQLTEVISARIERDYSSEHLQTLRWDNENILQQQPSSIESAQKNNHQTDESKNGCKPI